MGDEKIPGSLGLKLTDSRMRLISPVPSCACCSAPDKLQHRPQGLVGQFLYERKNKQFCCAALVRQELGCMHMCML